MKTKSKIFTFFEGDEEEIEKDINDFLKENVNRKIIDTVQSSASNEKGYIKTTLTIFYTDKRS